MAMKVVRQTPVQTTITTGTQKPVTTTVVKRNDAELIKSSPQVDIVENMRQKGKGGILSNIKCCIIPILIAFVGGYMVGTGKEKKRNS